MRQYLQGFGNHFSTEAEQGALPLGRNSPQKPPLGLYAEQFSGSAFTAPNHENFRTWFYRIRPSVVHGTAQKTLSPLWSSDGQSDTPPDPIRWSPLSPAKGRTWEEGFFSFAVSGSVLGHEGCGAHYLYFDKNDESFAFVNHDAEMLFVVQEGTLEIHTECGILDASSGWIVVIPRGMVFNLLSRSSAVSAYVCENFGHPFQLPYRGPIGANGLANHRDFEAPVAAFTTPSKAFRLVKKYLGRFYEYALQDTPFNVVAWHGNLFSYRYDLRRFNTMNTVSYDHPDPSIFTVLTSPSQRPGVANIDFVIFPPRWMVAEDTFRPPWFHRNIMSEFMGLLYGSYDAKPGEGFSPGGASLHNMMSPHGPDLEAFMAATNAELKPHKIDNTMAFMFESQQVFRVTDEAWKIRQKNYADCWQDLRSQWKK